MKILPLTYFARRNAMKKIDNPHVGKYMSLAEAKRIGFIIDTSLPESEKAVKYLCRELRTRKKDFYGIVIDSRKKKEAKSNPFPTIREVIKLTNKDINWYGKPKSDAVHNFLSEPFDIFIDLSGQKRNFTLDYIFKSAACNLRISTNYCKQNDYDLKVIAKENEEEQDEMISGFLLVKNIINYLTTIQ